MNPELIAPRLQAMAEAMEKDRGPIAFLALFFREEPHVAWDLVIAAPWLQTGRLKSYAYVIDHLKRFVGEGVLLDLARVVIFDYGGAFSNQLVADFNGRSGWVDAAFIPSTGVDVRRAYVITAKEPATAGR